MNIRTRNRIAHSLTARQLRRLLQNPLAGRELELDNLRQRTVRFCAYSYSPRVDMNLAEVRRVVIEEGCNLVIDLRDNPYVRTLVVKDNFIGRINLSRSSITKIRIGSNCRCDLIIHDSRECFKLAAADVFSGRLDIENSCFHHLTFGYYCYADLRLQDNCGRKKIRLGDAFRGSLEAYGLEVPEISAGNDCRGKIILKPGAAEKGVRRLAAGDDFKGLVDASYYPHLAWAEFGRRAAGKMNFQGCPGLRVLKFERGFKGVADLSDSGIEYIRALEEAAGSFIVVNCERLLQLKLPSDRKAIVTSDRYPLQVRPRANCLYYLFSSREPPLRYHTPFYVWWIRGIGRYLKREF